jgi:hypothetical protein
MTNETSYSNMYSQFVGPLDSAIQAICKNYIYSELYTIGALCSILKCNIRSIYPKIDFREDMVVTNNVFTPAPPIIANCEITVLWSHTVSEAYARALNNGAWSPNHFVPLLSPAMYHESADINQSTSTVMVCYLSVKENSRI